MKRYIRSATDNSADFEIDENGVLVEYHGNAANVVIPDGVREIGDYAFSDCRSLTNITIPDSVTEIGRSAFGGCSILTSITIPENVELGSDVFRNTPLESKFKKYKKQSCRI